MLKGIVALVAALGFVFCSSGIQAPEEERVVQAEQIQAPDGERV